MSFFHNTQAPGFSQAQDPFAGLSNRNDDDDALDFEDTYDGLGDQLEETGDAFNDDTFGGGNSGPSGGVGKDFDFFGQTAKVSNAMEDEHVRFLRQQPVAKAQPKATFNAPSSDAYQHGSGATSRPARTGYEKYREPEPVALQVDASIWGTAPKKQTAPAPTEDTASSRKVMSLEEVEAAMRAQSKKAAAPADVISAPIQQQGGYPLQGQGIDHRYTQPGIAPRHGIPPIEAQTKDVPTQHGHGHPVTILQRPQSKQTPQAAPKAPSPAVHQHMQQDSRQSPATMIQPTQILQNPNRLSGDASRIGAPSHPGHRSQGSFSQQHQLFGHQAQMALTAEEQAANLEENARRARRNWKISKLSKDNGIMTPQDKNFVTRIQLQQLVSATGNPNDHGTDESLNEDFYYQVTTQVRGGQRQHPGQPLSSFAQTYLHQTGNRHHGMRRHQRGPENHMQRMEQQVQRAVEAAKNKPKNKQLVIEGSLGKISFSNAKTPKPLLNIKRTESTGDAQRPGSGHKATPSGVHGFNRREVLRDIERVYNTLLKMEDHDRKMPPPATNEQDLDLAQRNTEWRETAQDLNTQLWQELKVHEPISEDRNVIHPFIAILSFPKGQKLMDRVFRHTTHEQRATILTMIIYNLDRLDIVRGARIDAGDMRLNAALRESIELFSATVMGVMFTFMSELDVSVVTGVLGIMLHLNMELVSRTRIGVAMLTMILSRAVNLKQSNLGSAEEWHTW